MSKPSAPSDKPESLPAPRVLGIVPPFPGGEENLLPKDGWLVPLRVEFDWWDDPAPLPNFADVVQLIWNDDEDNPVAEKRYDGSNYPHPPSDLWLEVPASRLREGIHTLYYRLLPWNESTAQRSQPVTITIDTRPPSLADSSKLLFPPAILPPGKITARYLSDPGNNDRVVATLPDYAEKKVGDTIKWYWEELPEGLDEVATWTLGVDDIAKPLELVFQGEVLRDRKNGRRYATYRVFDRAGNESVLSSRETVDVDIQPPPLRKHPTVKEAQNGVGTGVLDPQYYGVSGVTVVVPLQDDSSPGDKLEVYWKGYGDLGSYHASSPDPSNALQFHIPAKAIPANIGDNRIVEIWYTVAYSDNEPEKSDPLKLTVKPIAEAKFRLIDCPLAARGTPLKLKMSAVPAAGTALTLAAWVYQANTQLINIWLTDANNRREDIRTAWPVTIGTNRATLSKTFLTGVPINSTFSVHVSVSFDGGDTYLSFPRQEIQLLA
jgi:hypothetical protein